jgi:acyl-CoA thioesterase FadM
MNHAAIMSVMEMGRIDYMVRTGFLKLARKNKWYFPSSSISVQFFRPLKIFQKATVVTKVLHIDDKWIYLEQKITRDNKTMAICIVKSTIKREREHINIQEVLQQLNIGAPPTDATGLIETFEYEQKLAKERLG